MKPTCTSRRPYVISASTTLSAAPDVVASGFSHSTGLPVATQASTRSAWVSPGEAMSTASTAGSSMTSCPSRWTAAPATAATPAARSVSTSNTAVTRAPATRLVSRRTCSVPIIPVPMTPTFIACSLSFAAARA
ncbi:hypothetical protein Phou_009240 [Phytohabitans houttuyneae]|uniref:Uncharacterized protein n=1 Tax=Phytohabitans houttuyneae TaxID=1076126 RepID=A0A6V8JZL6_9ACTN|nr:hypothetical protein Phou_009240 [Phytohabitans houttuyneae]